MLSYSWTVGVMKESYDWRIVFHPKPSTLNKYNSVIWISWVIQAELL